jgi:hypothetical protein
MPRRFNIFWWATLLVANLLLLLPNSHPLRIIGALLFIGFLPGLTWANRFLADLSPLPRLTIAAALSYAITSLTTLLLHYLPGPVYTWHLAVILNLIAIIPLIINRQALFSAKISPTPSPPRPLTPIPLLLILAVALFLRAANLNYSEFQGDEALAMISAAEALEGHADALFLRSKGPGEVLLPMALWRLTGTINEGVARLPFTLASFLAIVTIYLIGQQLTAERAGWLAAGFFAFNGFMVGFGRIAQYQAPVVWMSALAFLLALYCHSTRRRRFAFLSGIFWGTGLLAHFDAVLVLPALGWLFLTVTAGHQPPTTNIAHPHNESNARTTQYTLPNVPHTSLFSPLSSRITSLLLFLPAALLTALPFYLPYSLDPQANRTGAYVGQRIGSELRNNLPDFFHFTAFYSSSYYLIITGLLVLLFFLWLLWQSGSLGRIVGAIATLAILVVTINPNGFGQLSSLPFAILFLAAFLALFLKKFSHPSASVQMGAPSPPGLYPNGCSPAPLQALLIWLAVPFLGYNFVVALGLTHIYTTVPAWSLLAAISINSYQLTMNNKLQISPHSHLAQNNHALRITYHSSLITHHLSFLLVILFALSTLFLWNAFVRHDIEYWQDYPDGNLALFWTPYNEPPQAGFFGFAHRAGWKAVGQKIAAGELPGDYGSNEEPDVTTWYTRGAPRACDPRPEYYFLADDLIDPVTIPADIIEANYQAIGNVTLPNQKRMRLMQQLPATIKLGPLNDSLLAQAFDWSATPAAFARSARGALPVDANFAHQIRLIGYNLDTRRAYLGGRVPVTLYWRAITPLQTSYHVFTHLESEGGPVAQADGVPVCWTYPTATWRPGQIIADQHAISIPPDTPPGEYPLAIGLYLPDTFERLAVLDEAGNPAGTSVELDRVKIRKLEIGD